MNRVSGIKADYHQRAHHLDSLDFSAVESSDFPFPALIKILSYLFHLTQSLVLILCLTFADLLITIFNLIIPSRPIHQTVPLPFSPDKPPPFVRYPFTNLICQLAKVLGPESPHWLRVWSVWDGVYLDGKWKEVNVEEANNGSRSPCPALNALANHGIINPSGRDLSFHQITSALSRTYNLSPTLAMQLLLGAYPILDGRKTINLSDLSTHGVIEHDASLLRPDLYDPAYKGYKDTQSRPWPDLINRFIPASSLPLTPKDLSHALTIRRIESANKNPCFHRALSFDLFGSGNCGLMIEITGGKRDEIRTWAGIDGIERFEAHWRPTCRQPFGVSILRAQYLMAKIELQTGTSFGPRARNV
ncbi:hypothetical protein DFH28DRAFT_1082765 [Melampsora americana]|nr:hypothetical protein DFH28DRAFT_1082765 [Melampsora americana]